MLKLFKVTYSGLWLGGKALVFAKNQQQALEKVKADSASVNFENAEAEEITDLSGVVFNENGNY